MLQAACHTCFCVRCTWFAWS